MTRQPGRLILPALRWRAETAASRHEAAAIADALDARRRRLHPLRRHRRSRSAGSPPTCSARAGRPLLIASDLERGAGQQVERTHRVPAAARAGRAGRRRGGPLGRRRHRAGGARGRHQLGVRAGRRSRRPARQSDRADPRLRRRAGSAWRRCVAAWIEGCQGAGALACAKHYPGPRAHDRRLPHHAAGRGRRRASTLQGQRPGAVRRRDRERGRLADDGARGLSRARSERHCRPRSPAPITGSSCASDLGFDGLVVTDALIMDGALVGRRESDAAVEAVAPAWTCCSTPRTRGACARRSSRRWPERRAASATRLDESLRRYERALAARHGADAAGHAVVPSTRRAALADALLAQGMLRGAPPALTGPLDLVVVDDDLGGPYPPGPSDWAARALGPELVGRYAGGSRVVLVFAEPRAWKGRAGFGAARSGCARRPGAAAPTSSCCSVTRDWWRRSRATRRCCWRGTASG